MGLDYETVIIDISLQIIVHDYYCDICLIFGMHNIYIAQ